MNIEQAIDSRYTNLAEKSCCLSCGGAINHAEIKDGEICLDLGSGRGTDVIRMAELAGENGFAYGVDVSDGMLAKAVKNAEKFGVSNVAFKKSTIEKLPFESDSITVMISNCTINHARDKGAVWSEVYRVLVPGGRFIVSDIYSEQPVPEKYRDDPEAVAQCWAGAVTKDEYINTLLACGFKDLTILEESDPYEKGQIRVSSFTIRGYK